MKTGLYLYVFLSVLFLSACDKTDSSNTTTNAKPAEEVTQEAAPAAEVQSAVSDAADTEAVVEENTETAVAQSTDSASDSDSNMQEDVAEVSELEGLQQYLEKYPNDGENFLTISPLKERLAALLGDDLDTFLANFETTGPLSEENGILFITGNKDNEGGKNESALVIDPSQDAIYAWLLKEGVAKEFKEDGKDITLPSDVKVVQENAASAP